jgi:CheY-like chemotaxis protein
MPQRQALIASDINRIFDLFLSREKEEQGRKELGKKDPNQSVVGYEFQGQEVLLQTEKSTPIAFSRSKFFDIYESFAHRLEPWPALNDPLGVIRDAKRKCFVRYQGTLFLLEIATREELRNAQSGKFITVVESTEGFLPRYFSKGDQEDDQKFSNQILPNGIFLTGMGKNNFSGQVLQAILPQSIRMTLRPEKSFIQSILPIAREKGAILDCAGADPVDFFLQILKPLESDPTLFRDVAKLIQGTFVYEKVRRTCAYCVKSTQIPKECLNRLPTYLAPEKQSYLFGRGCDKCGHSAYLGNAIISSTYFVSPEVRKILQPRFAPGELLTKMYQSGTRSILEEGLQAIESGVTSFEEVFAIATDPSKLWESIIIDGKHQPATFEVLPDIHLPEVKESKKKILIVEDDSSQREVLEIVFKNAGYQVSSAPSAKEAKNFLDHQSTDLLLCDLMMPEINGCEFVKTLRADKKYKKLPIMMLTALPGEENEFELLEAGADDYCVKTVKRKILLKRVEKLIELKN